MKQGDFKLEIGVALVDAIRLFEAMRTPEEEYEVVEEDELNDN